MKRNIKKSFNVVLVLAICLAMSVMTFASDRSFKDSQSLKASKSNILNQAKFKTVISIKIGNGEKEVGYSPREQENDGPSSFAVADDGKTFVLDTLNKKILVYQNLKWSKDINLSFCQCPRDITLYKNCIYILDESNLIYKINDDGKIENTVNLPDKLEAYQIEKISVNVKKHIIIETIDNLKYEITDEGVQKTVTTPIKVEEQANSAKLIKNGKTIFSIDFAECSGAINIIKDDVKGNTFINVQKYAPTSACILLESTLRIVNQNGQIAIAKIPIEDYYNYPLRFFNVTNNGDIYIMALKKDCVEIQKINLGITL